MDELSTKQLAELKKLLVQLQKELAEAITDGAEATKPVELDSSIGRVTRIDAIQQQSMAKAGREANKLRLSQVEVALKVMEQDNYGECISCGEFIPFKRLLVKPESLFCVECKEENEQQR